MAMKEGLIGRKVGMTQVFADDGNIVPVTVVQLGPNTVVGIRTKASHGYDALQLGFEPRRKNVTKAMAGVYKKAGIERPMRTMREVRLQKSENLAPYSVGRTCFKPFSSGPLGCIHQPLRRASTSSKAAARTRFELRPNG